MSSYQTGAVPTGHLTLHECMRALRYDETGSPTIRWREISSEKDEPEWLAELLSESRREAHYRQRITNACKEGRLTALVRHPITFEHDRIPGHWLEMDEFRSSVFYDQPLAAPPQSRLACINGLTPFVSNAEFQSLLSKPTKVSASDESIGTRYTGLVRDTAVLAQITSKRPSDEMLRKWGRHENFSAKSRVPYIQARMNERFGYFPNQRDAARFVKRDVCPGKIGRPKKIKPQAA